MTTFPLDFDIFLRSGSRTHPEIAAFRHVMGYTAPWYSIAHLYHPTGGVAGRIACYRRREDIRAADNILRIQLSDQIKGVRGELESIRDGMAMEGKATGLSTIGNAIFTLEGLEAKVRHAEGGYSGISATIRIQRTRSS